MLLLKKACSSFFAASCMAGAIAVSSNAEACSLASFSDNGRYIGGGLATQIASKSNTIQIVSVKARYLVHRTFTQGEWYLSEGSTEVPEGHPDFTDVFAFELEPVETLKMGGDPSNFVYENELRIAGYDPGVFGTSSPSERQISHPNGLPDWLLERPGNGGYAFHGASASSGLGGGECNAPYFLEVGQTLVALRDSLGRLYPMDGAFPLEIDTQFLLENGRRERLSLRMQSLIPISGPNDPFLVSLREALATRAAAR
ncbi:hypothetical protein [Brevundimonas sp.]|uniref:hypothetical protein n=1 Tax=Brevundimonas sp. TaxID=1871086 RepID=UPI0035B49A8D